ncbi:MAG: hypothetical protein GF320_18775 [Armatimonadia bacterium]|nr:hypothetical protein [Armatimonadia bacterium]
MQRRRPDRPEEQGQPRRPPDPTYLAHRDVARARDLGLQQDPEALQLMMDRLQLPEDPTIAELLQVLIQDAALVHQFCPNPFRSTAPMPGSFPRSGILLGHEQFTHSPVFIDGRQVAEGVVAVGAPGSGKTTELLSMVAQLARAKVSVLILDLKRDFRTLAALLPDLIHVFPTERFPVSVAEVAEGISPRSWASLLTGAAAHAWGLFEASQSYLLRCLNALYRDRSIYSNGSWWPSIQDIRNTVIKPPFRVKRNEEQYRDRLVLRLDMLCTVLPAMARRWRGLPVESPRYKAPITVLELDGLDAGLQAFLVDVIILRTVHRQLARGHRGGLDKVLVIDEATRVFDAQRERQERHLNTVVTGLQQCRELGIGMLLAAQEPGRLSRTVMGCTGTKLAMAAADGNDAGALGRILGLDREQARYIHHLERGQAVVRMLRGHTDPFLMRVPNLPFDKNAATDDYLERTMAGVWRDLDGMQRPSGVTALPSPGEPKQSRAEQGQKTAPPAEPQRHGAPSPADGSPCTAGAEPDLPNPDAPHISALPEDRRRLLIDVATHLWSWSSHREKRLGLSSRQVDSFRKWLERHGYIRCHRASTGRRGGVPVLMEPTDKGWAEVGLTKPKGLGKGGHVHQFWQHTIADHYRSRGGEATLEGRVGDKQVDVLAVLDGRTIAIEVQLSDAHSEENLRRDLEPDLLDELVVACDRGSVVKRVQRLAAELPAELSRRVHICPLGHFLSSKED